MNDSGLVSTLLLYFDCCDAGFTRIGLGIVLSFGKNI